MPNQHTMVVHLHAYINGKYIFQLHNIIIANDRANVRHIQSGIKRVDWSITGHSGWSMLMIRCNNGVGGEERHGCWSRFSGHTTSTLHTLLLALFTPPPPHSAAIQEWKKLSCTTRVMSHRPFDRSNNDYVSPCPSATCRGFSARHYWYGQWAVQLIECTPPSDYYTSVHWRYWFSDVQCSSDFADVRCPMCDLA